MSAWASSKATMDGEPTGGPRDFRGRCGKAQGGTSYETMLASHPIPTGPLGLDAAPMTVAYRHVDLRAFPAAIVISPHGTALASS
jgi:hypothetical protein